MTDTGPDPDSTDTPATEPDDTDAEPVRDPFEEAVVDEEVVEEDPDDDAGV